MLVPLYPGRVAACKVLATVWTCTSSSGQLDREKKHCATCGDSCRKQRSTGEEGGGLGLGDFLPVSLTALQK